MYVYILFYSYVYITYIEIYMFLKFDISLSIKTFSSIEDFTFEQSLKQLLSFGKFMTDFDMRQHFLCSSRCSTLVWKFVRSLTLYFTLHIWCVLCRVYSSQFAQLSLRFCSFHAHFVARTLLRDPTPYVKHSPPLLDLNSV